MHGLACLHRWAHCTLAHLQQPLFREEVSTWCSKRSSALRPAASPGGCALSAPQPCRYMITSLDRTHAGFYRCIVRNRMGALLQRQTEVQVACK